MERHTGRRKRATNSSHAAPSFESAHARINSVVDIDEGRANGTPVCMDASHSILKRINLWVKFDYELRIEQSAFAAGKPDGMRIYVDQCNG